MDDVLQTFWILFVSFRSLECTAQTFWSRLEWTYEERKVVAWEIRPIDNPLYAALDGWRWVKTSWLWLGWRELCWVGWGLDGVGRKRGISGLIWRGRWSLHKILIWFVTTSLLSSFLLDPNQGCGWVRVGWATLGSGVGLGWSIGFRLVDWV